MDRIINTGLKFHLQTGNGKVVQLTIPQYRTLRDLQEGVITEEQKEERYAYYLHCEEFVDCPHCENGKIKREFIWWLERDDNMKLHEAISHMSDEAIRLQKEQLDKFYEGLPDANL